MIKLENSKDKNQKEIKKNQIEKNINSIKISVYGENSIKDAHILIKNTYLFSSISQEPHYYNLKLEKNKQRVILIELAICDGRIDYSLENINGLEISEENSFGKKLIFIELKEGEEDIESINDSKIILLQIINLTSKRSDYALKYKTYSKRENVQIYTLEEEGLVTVTKYEDEETKILKNVDINWGNMLINGDKTFKGNYFIKISNLNAKNNEAASICCSFKRNEVEEKFSFILKKISFNENILNFNLNILEDYKDYDSIKINIIARADDGTLLAYKPVSITIKESSFLSFSILLWIIIFIITFTFIFLIIRIYKKYQQKKLNQFYQINLDKINSNQDIFTKKNLISNNNKEISRNSLYSKKQKEDLDYSELKETKEDNKN